MTDTIDYSALMHDAMRDLIRKVLEDVARDGLPGAHHFFITLDTRHAEVELSDWLRERYPESITIVLQNWFEDLSVRTDGFSVTLSFNNNPERLSVPFDAVQSFVDPSVEFGLRFETIDEKDETVVAAPELADEAPMVEDADPAAEQKSDAEIVSLDKFRK